MSQPNSVKITSLGELVGTAPSLLGYTPEAGDVTVVVIGANGRIGVTANIPAASWGDLADDSSLVAGELNRSFASVDPQELCVMGHGPAGEFRALALKDELSNTYGDFLVFGVQDEQYREIEHGFDGQWRDQTPPNPSLAVDHHVAGPASNRQDGMARYAMIESDVPTDSHLAQARTFVSTLPNSAREQAALAVELLRSAGPGSAPETRAMIGEILTASKNVRDASFSEILGENPPDLENITYVARTSHAEHRPTLSAVAVSSHYFQRTPLAVAAFGERIQDNNLGKLVLMAHDMGMPPTEDFKNKVLSATKEAMSLPAHAEGPNAAIADLTKAAPSRRPTSVEGVNPHSGPGAGPGISGPGS